MCSYAELLHMVRRDSVWYGVAQLIARRLAVRQARVRFSARHHREVFPTELTSDEEMERDLGEWRRINFSKNMKNKQEEWHHAIKPLKITALQGIYRQSQQERS
jgi:hypothetical protein